MCVGLGVSVDFGIFMLNLDYVQCWSMYVCTWVANWTEQQLLVVQVCKWLGCHSRPAVFVSWPCISPISPTYVRTCHLQKYRSLSPRSCSTRFCTLMKSGSASIHGVLCRRWSLRTVRLKRCGTGCRKFWRRRVGLTSGRPVRLSSVMLLWVTSRRSVKLHLSPNTSLPLYLGEFSS